MQDTNSSEKTPAISVIIVGRDGFKTLAPIIPALMDQTVAHRMQLIVVLPEDEEPPYSADALSRFAEFRKCIIGRIGNRGVASAKAVPLATAPVIAFTENHCFPDPNWAEVLSSSYADGISGVSPVIGNANPLSALSWATYASGYAAFVSRDRTVDIEEMPIHNTSYRADVLKQRMNRLEDLLLDERNLQADIREEGGRFIQVPDTISYHVNEAVYGLTLSLCFINGRRFGTKRARDMSWPRRLAMAGGFPLLSGPIYQNQMRRLENVEAGKRSAKFYFDVWLTAVVHALGEAVAYVGLGKEEFPFLEREEFMLTERLGNRSLPDERHARFARLASPVSK